MMDICGASMAESGQRKSEHQKKRSKRRNRQQSKYRTLVGRTSTRATLTALTVARQAIDVETPLREICLKSSCVLRCVNKVNLLSKQTFLLLF
ncbi:hypothetical protein AAC387_Pa02g3725 [Persea americana]